MGQTGVCRQDARSSEGQRQEAASETRCEVSLYKRGEVYWYKFMFNGQRIRESTRQGNDKVARQMEAAHRTSLAKGEVGIRDKKTVPTLADFCKSRLEPWAKATFEQTVPNSWLWFKNNIRVICEPGNKLASL